MADKQKLSKEALVIVKDNGKDQIRLDYGNLRRAVLTLRALNHPLRKKMLTMIEEKRKFIFYGVNKKRIAEITSMVEELAQKA